MPGHRDHRPDYICSPGPPGNPDGPLASRVPGPPLPRARKICCARGGRDLVIHIRIDDHVGSGAVRLAGGVADVGVVGAGGDHHALDHLPHLFLRSCIAGSEFSDRTVDVGLAPENRRTIVEQLEVVQVVTFLLHDLELYVLVVEVGIEGG
jgi:hypothetical protein